MADTLISTNLVPRPNIRIGEESSPMWVRSNGLNAQCNGRASDGRPVVGVYVDKTDKASAPIEPLAESAEYEVIAIVAGHQSGFSGGVQVGFTYDLAVAPAAGSMFQDTTVAGQAEFTITGTIAVPSGTGQLYLVVQSLSTASREAAACHVREIRLSAAPIMDSFGIFTGDTPDTEEYRFDWAGLPDESASEVYAIEVVPPEPEPPAGLGADVAKHLGRADDTELIALADGHASIVTEYVRGYTRGRGFDPETDEPNKGLRAVIVASTARLSSNPEQVSYYASGDYSERPAVLAGWTLPELAVLHNYRKRWA